MFATCLPHPRTIAKWYQSVDSQPGFTSSALKSKAESIGNKPMICSLLMDEMAIRQHMEWDGKKYHGYIDMGTGLDDDSLPIAKEALTFMVVALNGSWKLPVGYFLIDGLCAAERSNLVKQCLEKLHSVGVTVMSLTFDGAASNLAMIKHLGCNLDPFGNFKTQFPHPSTQNNVSVFLDPCHMLKLVRNTLADKGSLADGDNQLVKWNYIEALHKFQENEGLHIGNKLRSAHIEWYKKKMNVKLAAQLLNDSVACSLEFCIKEKISAFNGCEATIKFIRIFNTLFDILNSRNLKAYGWKCPFQERNCTKYVKFLKEARSYLMSIKQSCNGISILQSNRKTGFIGFIICIDSLLSLYQNTVACQQVGLKYLLSFKISQDHLELFFGKIRSLGGCNNNPTVRQFSSAYKRLFFHNEIQDVLRGNCLPLQTVPILTVSSNCINVNSDPPSVSIINSTISKNRLLDMNSIETQELNDNDYVYIPDPMHLSLCLQK